MNILTLPTFARRRPQLSALAALLGLMLAGPAGARCIDEDSPDSPAPGTAAAQSFDASTPRLSLNAMVQEAMRRSNAVGAAKLLAEAAASDLEETRAASRFQATMSGTLGLSSASAKDVKSQDGGQAVVSVNLSAPLWDAGRSDELTGWRSSLADAARLGQLTAAEQVAFQTVSLALERSRFRQQARVYQQYGRKMACLVEALDQIVRADKGRTSELVQARKTLQQAELSQTQTVAQLRQTEIKLRRFIGDALPSGEGMSALLLDVPPLAEMEAQAARASEIGQLDAQAQALESYSRAVQAGQRPQVNWLLSGSKAAGGTQAGTVLAGISVSVPLLNPGADHSLMAAQKRAEAARLQRAEALEARRNRMADVIDQASSSFERARQVNAVLRNTDQVRNFTLQQWQQLGRRSLFDVMAAEGEHYNLRVAYVNALHDGQQASALLRSLGLGISAWLQ